ncbi:DMT family transporter, partial [Thioclava sp. BHET1]
MIPLIAAFNPRRLHRVLATRRPALHLTRVLFQMGAIACFFTALRHIGLASATAIADLAPCLITLGAALILREKIGPRRIAGVGVALIGALIIIRPGSDVFSPWAVLPLVCAICFAGGAICSRKIGRDDSVWTSLSFSAVTGTLLGTIALPFVWTPPALGDLGLFLALGLLGSVGQLFFLRAFALAEASLIAPFA